MGKKYTIKLRGTNCYLRNTSDKGINFTTDIRKAKIFERVPEKMDIIDKLNAREYKVRKESHKSDNIRLTMDKATWQELYNNHFDQILEISDCRLNIHQYSFSLIKKFEAKVESYRRNREYPNFECDYYGEDFERESI
jgi:hypothetical protein